MFSQQENRLIYKYDSETLWIEPWGPHALRIRATHQRQMPLDAWALDQEPLTLPNQPKITIDKDGASITNGKIKATLTPGGKLMVYNTPTGTLLLEEYSRNRTDVTDPKCSALSISARDFRPIPGSDSYRLTARFESVSAAERIYGMGQYQHGLLDLKGVDLELAQRNSQTSIPFAVSSLGYGLLWNNPAVGRVVFGRNGTTWEAAATLALDYWVVAGDEPREIVRAYADVVGKPPAMPECGLGFWQSKLRYQTQEELLGVAREHQRRGLPLDVIVVDFFHWPVQGEWKFDARYWPDPAAMVAELREMGVELMVSIWPTVDKRSENYAEMLEKGYLMQMDRGMRTAMDFMGDTVHVDFTNPEACDYVWQKVKTNYWDKGIRLFWLDEAEPEYTTYDFDNHRHHLGPALRIGNLYPRCYASAFSPSPLTLIRSAWPGSQRHPTILWTGDTASSWPSLRAQLPALLNTSLAGHPWVTTDIGGFHGGDPGDPGFRELFVRWFQLGVFSPVMRLHGDREPHGEPLAPGECASGAGNEVWSYGEEVYGICRRWMRVREGLRGYLRECFAEASERGEPVVRPVW